MQEAVGRFVPHGASVCMGTALEALIPFAAGHELIRHRRRDLTLVGPISDILSDPGLVLTPALKVAAVVPEPFGAYPSPVEGSYGRGHDFYHRYHEETRTVEGARAWLDRWIYGVADWNGFLAALGPKARDAVRVKTPRLSEPLDYGA